MLDPKIVDEAVAFKIIPTNTKKLKGYQVWVYYKETYQTAYKIAQLLSRRFGIEVAIKLE